MEIDIKILFVAFVTAATLRWAWLAHIALENKVKALEGKVEKMEQASRQRLPYRSFDEIINAMAALDALEHEESFKQSLIQNAKGHLAKSMAIGTKREEK